MMRAAILASSLVWSLAACGTDAADPYATQTFEFGPYPLAPAEESVCPIKGTTRCE